MIDEGARRAAARIVIGYDMRDSSPCSRRLRRWGDRPGLDVVRIGLASTDELYFASGIWTAPARCSPPATTPPPTTASTSRAAAKPVGEDTGLALIRDAVINGVPAGTAPCGRIHDQDVLHAYGDFLHSLVDVSGLRAPARRRRCRQMAWLVTPPRPCWAPFRPDPAAAVPSELDGSFPNHEANPLEPGQPGGPAGLRRRRRCRHRTGIRRRRRPMLRRRRVGPTGVAVGHHRTGGRPRTGP